MPAAVVVPASSRTTDFGIQPQLPSAPLAATPVPAGHDRVYLRSLEPEKHKKSVASFHPSSSLSSATGGSVSLSLTHVVYTQGDPVGLLLSIITLSPIYIVVMYATLVAFRRDIDTFLALLGQLVGVAVTVGIKKAVDQPRPDGAHLDDEGMPSSHAQFIWFFAGWISLCIYTHGPWCCKH